MSTQKTGNAALLIVSALLLAACSATGAGSFSGPSGFSGASGLGPSGTSGLGNTISGPSGTTSQASPSTSPSSSPPPRRRPPLHPRPHHVDAGPPEANGAWCSVSVHSFMDYDHDEWLNDVYVHSNQPYQSARASAQGYSWSYETDASGYADIYLNGPTPGAQVTVTVGGATCSGS